MTQNPIVNKHCFIRRPSGKAYCSKCGAVALQDTYNCKKHSQRDNFSPYDLVEIFDESKDFAYGWSDLGAGKVGFTVFTPKLMVRPGFEGCEKFVGGKWIPIYQCIFDTEHKKIIEKEGGVKNIDYWKTFDMPCLNVKGEYASIYQFFHVPGCFSLANFVDIFRHHGMRYNALLTDEEARAILQEGEEMTREEIMYSAKAGYIRGQVINAKDTKILRLDIRHNKEDKVFKLLIAENYFFSDDKLNVKQLLKGEYYHIVNEEELAAFAKANPGFGLMNYWNVNPDHRNILIPLLSGVYDEGLELLSKAGLVPLANHYYTHMEFEMFPKCGNIKDWLGVPVKVLKRVAYSCLHEEKLLLILRRMYAKAPEYLESGVINLSELLFFKENVLAELQRNRTSIEGFRNFSKDVKLRMARYLGEKAEDRIWPRRSYGVFVDYLNLSHLRGRYEYGYTPDNLDYAHDAVLHLVRRIGNLSDKANDEEFQKRVESEEYKRLESSWGEESELFEKDEFLICSPHTVEDLYRESEALHHCVRIYSGRVARGTTNIYFLRWKPEPNIPFATIEVCNGKIVQLKASCNSKAPLPAQKFVRKWAEVKKLAITSSDFEKGEK